MKAFLQIDSLKENFDYERLAYAASIRELDAITAAITQRQEEENRQHETRRAGLHAKAADMSRPVSVRRLAALELESMKEYIPTVTENEVQAFMDEAANAKSAMADLLHTSNEIKEAIKQAKEELEQVRTDTLRKTDFVAMQHSLQGSIDSFNAIRGCQ